jgi:argininosuccinate lyase
MGAADESTEAKKALWAGRFSAQPEGELERFGASLGFDQRMWRQDIAGSTAHAKMLGSVGVLSQEDVDAIVAGLAEIGRDIEAGNFTFDVDTDEDIHMAIERVLTERIGDAGGRLHTGRSRNDQSVTDTRLAAKQFAGELAAATAELMQALFACASAHKDAVMPGYTHMQPAQPVLFAHHMLAYFWMFDRDVKRFEAAEESADASPLGAAALAGTTYPLDRFMSARSMGFSAVIPNSMDAVSDRDFLCDLVYACSMCQMHLSRLCEELVWWSSAEFRYVEMDDAHATGSSIMPQKKNPDFAELVRGKTGRVYGDLVSLLTMLKGLPMTYDKDLQEDKEPMFDAFDTVIGSLHAVTGMISTMEVHEERMRENAGEGFMAATDLADYLVGKGVPFRHAHAIVGHIVADCIERGVTLQDLSAEDLAAYDEAFGADACAWVDIDNVVARRTTYGGTGHAAVAEQLELAEAELAKLFA